MNMEKIEMLSVFICSENKQLVGASSLVAHLLFRSVSSSRVEMYA